MGGQAYREILAHYQPNCALRDMSGPPRGTFKGVVYHDDINDQANRISGATVTMDGANPQVFDGANPWQYEADLGAHNFRAEAAGYQPNVRSCEITAAGELRWCSIQLTAESSDAGADAGPDAGADAGSDAGSDPAPGDGSGDDKGGGGCGCGGTGGAGFLEGLILACWLADRSLRRRI
jgi:hypothetical protein